MLNVLCKTIIISKHFIVWPLYKILECHKASASTSSNIDQHNVLYNYDYKVFLYITNASMLH